MVSEGGVGGGGVRGGGGEQLRIGGREGEFGQKSGSC